MITSSARCCQGLSFWIFAGSRYADQRQAVDAVDRACAATRAAFNAIDLAGVGPHKEARVLLERLKAMPKDGGSSPDWKDFKAAREAFVAAASAHLKSLRAED